MPTRRELIWNDILVIAVIAVLLFDKHAARSFWFWIFMLVYFGVKQFWAHRKYYITNHRLY